MQHMPEQIRAMIEKIEARAEDKKLDGRDFITILNMLEELQTIHEKSQNTQGTPTPETPHTYLPNIPPPTPDKPPTKELTTWHFYNCDEERYIKTIISADIAESIENEEFDDCIIIPHSEVLKMMTSKNII